MPAISSQVGGYHRLIEPYARQSQPSHHVVPVETRERSCGASRRSARSRSPAIERSSVAKSADEAPFRTISIKSQPFSTWVRRAASLSLRFILFRTTALPTLLPTEKPNRVASSSFGRATRTSRSLDQLLPHRRAAAKSFPRVRRCAFCIGQGLWVRLRDSDRQSLAPLEHATTPDVAPAAGAHSCSEAVYAAPTSFAWLIGPFRHQ